MQAVTAALSAPDAPRLSDPAAAARPVLRDERAHWSAYSREIAARPGEFESYLAIDGMYCPACSLVIEEALGRLPGVHSVEVSGATATCRIVWSPARGRPTQWAEALREAGYAAVPAGDQLATGARRLARRTLLWRWLVAGFCMMQVMMYATPAYVAGPGEMTADVASLLRWASCLLTLPVLLFSCRPFFASAWRDVRQGRIGMDVPVSLGLLIAFAASVVATADPRGPLGAEVWYDSVTMFVFFLLSGRLLEQRLRDRTAGALEALTRRLPATANRLRADGTTEIVALGELAVGDRVRVVAGDVVPADGVLLAGRGELDEALLTGESAPGARRAGDAVVAGSRNLDGSFELRIDRVGADTRFGEIVALMERAGVGKPASTRLADRFARPFLLAVLLAAAASAAWWWSAGPAHAIGIAIAVLIVTCPCALSLAAPAATLAAAGALARQGVLVRHLDALESAARIDTLVFDKTGTLTADRMGITGTRVRDGADAQEALALAAALARHSLHPASRALVAATGASGWTASQVREHAGQGVEGVVAGDSGWQPRHLRLGSAAYCGAPASDEPVAQVHLADAAGWLASFDLDEALRPEAVAAIGTLRRDRLALEVLSGDRDAAVQRLAWRAGIATSRGQQAPQEKLDRVMELQAQGHRVAMVGDGMNDGPVLARADVSIAMGQGVPVAQSRADFILLGNQLDRIPLVLAHARRTHRIVRQNLAWAAAYNAVCVPLALAGAMPPWLAGLGMAASSLLVVANSARLARVVRRT